MTEEKKPGNPTKYDPKFIQMLLDYFSIPIYTQEKRTLYKKNGDVVEFVGDAPADFPSLSGFAIKIGVHRDTLLEWSKVHEEFRDVYQRAKDYQENYLLVNSLKGIIEATPFVFIAKNVLNYRDKQPGEEDKTLTHKMADMSDAAIEDRIKKLTGADEA